MLLRKADDAQDIPLPNAAFLDCHYRLAEILNALGMAEVIERSFREWKDLKGSCHVIREDGKTDVGQYLHIALWAHVVS